MTTIETCPLVVCTKNAPEQLQRLLASARQTGRGPAPPVVVIDDSSSPEARALNRRAAESLPGGRALYVDAAAWEEMAAESVLPRLRRPEHAALVGAMRLGVPEWNTENARNIGQLVSVVFLKGHAAALNLDGDMVLPRDFFPLRVGRDRPLRGIRITGCPDYSRFEWLQHYARTVAMRYLPHAPSRHTLYVEAVMGGMSRAQAALMLSRYSDFEVTADADDSPNGLFRFPQRREFISGGAYLSSIANASVSMFPGWYDEDWFWVDAVQRATGGAAPFLDAEMSHEPGRKRVLLREFMEFEERGRILTAVVREAGGPSVTAARVGEALRRRAAFVADELDFVRRLAGVRLEPAEREQVEAVLARLRQLIELLAAESPEAYVAQIAAFARQNRLWSEVVAVLQG